jgi:membrane protease YdiL (CAAX protease family)
MAAVAEVSANETDRPRRSLVGDVGLFLLITFSFTWVLEIGAIKLGLGEEYLNLGSAGPAIAALLLSQRSSLSKPQWSARRLALFAALMLVSWMVASVHYALWDDSGQIGKIAFRLLIPALFPAWILSRAFSEDEGVRSLARRVVYMPDRWSALALFFFPVLLGFPSAIAYLLGARLIWPGLGGFKLSSFVTAAMFFFYNILFAGLQEEPGWRGFLLDRWQQKYSPLWSSILVWLPWALWHAPVDYYRPVRFSLVDEILLRVVFLIPLTIILTWFYNRSARSIQCVVLFHAAMNTFPYVAAYYQPAWFVVFAFAAYAVVRDRMWSRVRRETGATSFSRARTQE